MLCKKNIKTKNNSERLTLVQKNKSSVSRILGDFKEPLTKVRDQDFFPTVMHTSILDHPRRALTWSAPCGISVCPYQVRVPNYFLKYEVASKKTIVSYCILIEHKFSLNVKSLRFRYTELRILHDRIIKELQKLKIALTLPTFPSRKIIGSTNTNHARILQRKAEIEKYLNELIAFPQIQSLSLISHFLPAQMDLHNRSASSRDAENGGIEDSFRKGLFNPQNKKSQLVSEIKGFERTGDTIFYTISFYHLASNLKWETKCRYTELRNLSLGIRACAEDKDILPEFPGTHMFKSTNGDFNAIFKRMQSLEQYLNEILEIENIHQTNEALINFIESSKRNALSQELIKQGGNEEMNPQIQQTTSSPADPESSPHCFDRIHKMHFERNTSICQSFYYNEPPETILKQQKKILIKKAKTSLIYTGLQTVFEEATD